MKKLILFFALASTLAFTGCSKDEDDQLDAIVGTWINESSITPDGGSTTTYEDTWVFNSDLTGEYTEATNGDTDFEDTFTWIRSEDSYIVVYADDDSTDTFTIGELLGSTTLEQGDTIVAVKE